MGPYWYLHTLILCSLIYYITFRYVRLSVVSRLVVTGVCLFALSHWGGLMNFSNALYFLIGMTVSQSGLRFTQVFRATTFAIVPFVILCCFPANLDRGTLAGVAITWLSISLLLAQETPSSRAWTRNTGGACSVTCLSAEHISSRAGDGWFPNILLRVPPWVVWGAMVMTG